MNCVRVTELTSSPDAFFICRFVGGATYVTWKHTVVVYTVDCAVALIVYVISSASTAGVPMIAPPECNDNPLGSAGVISNVGPLTLTPKNTGLLAGISTLR